ncbi:unnamed protein product [Lupinus luteus]|uniref:Ubiquitin-like domain-containing protein n=1 Tax=Lupinus luteus TaxID=3873 RepID=A0AAV1X8L1_LUPLU
MKKLRSKSFFRSSSKVGNGNKAAASAEKDCSQIKWELRPGGELKMILSLITRLEPREQRLLFKGKERDDNEFLHMVGVRDKDKVLLLQDPAIKEKKLLVMARSQPINNLCFNI